MTVYKENPFGDESSEFKILEGFCTVCEKGDTKIVEVDGTEQFLQNWDEIPGVPKKEPWNVPGDVGVVRFKCPACNSVLTVEKTLGGDWVAWEPQSGEGES